MTSRQASGFPRLETRVRMEKELPKKNIKEQVYVFLQFPSTPQGSFTLLSSNTPRTSLDAVLHGEEAEVHELAEALRAPVCAAPPWDTRLTTPLV